MPSTTLSRPTFDWKFRIEVEAIEVDYTTHVTTIHVPAGMSPDPDRMIEIFLWLDPALKRIDVVAGGEPLLCHKREAGGWVTHRLHYRSEVVTT